MYRSWRTTPIAIAAAAVGLMAAIMMQANSALEKNVDRNAMIGTWTDEDGPPGNSIRFYYVQGQKMPGDPVITAWEGRATVVGLLDEKEAPAIWNYGSWDPFVVNLVIGKKAWCVAFRKLDDDHLLMRFSLDAEAICQPGSIEHPETRRFKRIGREPGF
jgi:hypothetical protein